MSSSQDDDKDPPTSGKSAGPTEDAVEDSPGAASSGEDAKREAAKAAAKAEARAKVEARTKAAAEGEEAGSEEVALERRDLPKWNRARVKRKAPAGEDQDAFQTSVRQAGRGAVRRAPLLLIAVVLVAGGIGGFIWWRGQSAAEAAGATQMLATAAAYQARARVEPNLEAVLGERARPPVQPLVKDEAELRRTVDAALGDLETQAAGTKAAKLGQLVRAAQAMRDARFADAESSFRAFVQDEPGHELAFLAQEGILLAREAQADAEGALAQAESLIAADRETFYRDQALWHKARLLEELGREDEALTAYRQYAEEYPLQDPSVARAQVIERLRELDPSAVPAGIEAEGPGPEIDLGALLQ